MSRWSIYISVFLTLGLIGSACADTLFYWSFEGTLGENIISDTDSAGGITVNVFTDSGGTGGGSLTYGEGVKGTAGDFLNPDPDNTLGTALFVNDQDVLDLKDLSQFTIEGFINVRTDRQSVCLVRKYGGNGRYYVDIRGNGTASFVINSDLNIILSAPGTIEVGKWHHVAATFDEADTAAPMKLYVDYALAASGGIADRVKDSSRSFGIGCIVRDNLNPPGNTGQFFDGLIDEVRISDVALEPDDFLTRNPVVVFQAWSSQGIESISPAQIALSLSNGIAETVTVDYTVTGGTAANGVDYTLADGTLSFDPDQTDPELISISITDDDMPEDNETIDITLLNPVNVDLGGVYMHTYTILDDDTLPTVEFETTQSANPENVTPAVITVRLSQPYKETVMVDYSVTGGTATRNIDYILADGTLAFSPYETAKNISIDVILDELGEGDETIEVTLSHPVNASLGDNVQHVYTIRDTFINSFGMEFTLISPGTFVMGSEKGVFDEKPVHNVTISQPFYTGVTEVTNAQYEQFDPNHSFINHYGFAHEPNEAVIFVSWEEANAFCEWLSQQQGQTYRLPTEAEWEYACRAGTTTNYHTGDTLPEEYHKNAKKTRTIVPVPLVVAQTPPNAWGLYDMHGNVEEWCYDWYGPYESGDQTDPVGRVDGNFKVNRGGSHATEVLYLRSACRIGAIPEDKHWLIGFRVVRGELPVTEPLPLPPPQPYQVGVSQQIPPDIEDGPDPDVPYFGEPRRFVNIAPGSTGELFSNHNHVPNIIQCPNGDLFATWYSTISETGREMTVAVSRLRYGGDEWDQASLFWNLPNRNDHTTALWVDENGKIYHFQGLPQASWHATTIALMLRTSTDNGVTWSWPRLIRPERKAGQMPIESVFRTSGGTILLPCDTGGNSALLVSEDDGLTWINPGGTIVGIHAPVAELTDGRLLAFGRGGNIGGLMPQSISSDMGKTWTTTASIFPPISSNQRSVLIRLKEGPLFFASFTGPWSQERYMPIPDDSGGQRLVTGLFGAISYDDGQTWANIRLISHDGPDQQLETIDGRPFTLGFSKAEPRGYLSVWQGRNGVIHLISSRQHYAFNYKWLTERACVVNLDDLAGLSAQWLETGPELNADLNEDGVVDLRDYSILAYYWLEGCPGL